VAEARPDLLPGRLRIRAAHEERVATWPATRAPLVLRASVRVDADHRKTATVGSFTIASDEGAIVGGEGTAPTPLSLFTSAVGLAVLTDLVRAFAVHDLPVTGLELTIETEVPLAAKYAGEDGPVAASEVRYTVDITSEAPPDAVAAAVGWAERFCHAVHSLREPVPVRASYRLGGVRLPTG
jgi:uncharacterized OsmC-like protein